VKLAAAGREKGLARRDADFLQRLKAVGNESGADDVYPFRSGLGHGDQRRLRIGLQPLGEAEARLESYDERFPRKAEASREQFSGGEAMSLVRIAPIHRTLRQAVEAHHQPLAAPMLGPVSVDVRGERVDISWMVVELPHHANARRQQVEHAAGGAGRVLGIQGQDDRIRKLRKGGCDRRPAVAHGVLDLRAGFLREQVCLAGGVHRQRRAFGGPDQAVLFGGFRRPGAQDDAVKDRQPKESRQLHHPRVGKELSKISTHRLRGRGGGSAEVDEQNGAAAGLHKRRTLPHRIKSVVK